MTQRRRRPAGQTQRPSTDQQAQGGSPRPLAGVGKEHGQTGPTARRSVNVGGAGVPRTGRRRIYPLTSGDH